ncbi:MAG: DUF899 family protein [Parvularculaceae bacterium]
MRFPGESAEYRAARNRLLVMERDLRRQSEAVAAARRALPPGGAVPDYEFVRASGPSAGRAVRLHELFASGKPDLLIYSFMFGAGAATPCPYCVSLLDALDGNAQAISKRANLAVVAKCAPARIGEFSRDRGWRNLVLLSSAGNTYNTDYFGENAEGEQTPMINSFRKSGAGVIHVWGSELLFLPPDDGQDPRHADFLWPLWNALDMTASDRGGR